MRRHIFLDTMSLLVYSESRFPVVVALHPCLRLDRGGILLSLCDDEDPTTLRSVPLCLESDFCCRAWTATLLRHNFRITACEEVVGK